MRPVETVEDSGASNECWGRMGGPRNEAGPDGAVNTDEALTTTTVWSHDGCL